MNIDMDPLQKQMLDDVFDAFTMLTEGSIVTLMHVDGGFTRYTASAVELFGLPGEYIPNGAMNWADWVHPDDRERYLDAMALLLEGESQAYDLTYRVKTTTDDYVNFRAVGAVLRGADGRPNLIGGAMFNEDLTHAIDPVTALPNKVAFRRDLAEHIRADKDIYALQIGVSQFSEINRTRGYTYGNRVLQEMAWLVQEAVNERGKVYCLDGATFAIMSESLSRKEISAIYDYLRIQLQRGIEVNGDNNVLIAGGGLISTLGAETDALTTITCLNYAYSESQERLHGELVDFNGSVNYERVESLEIMREIRESIGNGCEGFRMDYYPVIDAKTGHMNGAEAMFFWESEERGKVLAKDFMPILERDYIFEELGDYVLEQSLSDGVKFIELDPDFLLCLNVRRVQLDSDYFIDNLRYYLRETGFPAPQLSVKFDSSCRSIGMERMNGVIDKLHELGILVIIGDFGTGVDSIGFLKTEPVDAVSIGAQFMAGIRHSEEDRSTLAHLAQIASNYVEHVNVKGIHDEELYGIVREMSVSTVQGAYYSRPLTFEEMVAKYYSD